MNKHNMYRIIKMTEDERQIESAINKIKGKTELKFLILFFAPSSADPLS